MSEIEFFERVAARELSPDEAARKMMEADRQERARLRPPWVPRWAWAAGLGIIALLCIFAGIQNRGAQVPDSRLSEAGERQSKST
jgi:hypothetical protein